MPAVPGGISFPQVMQELPRGHDDDASPLRQTEEMLIAADDVVAKKNLKGVGGKLQYQDSQIMDRILTTLSNNNIPAIPIHDSNIVPAQNVQFAKSTMIEAYQVVTETDHVPHITIEQAGEK